MRLLLALIILAFASNSFAAEGRIYGQMVNTSGAAVGSPIELNSGTTGQPQSIPQVAFFDDRFLVVYQEWNGSDLDVKAVRVGMDGTVLDTTPITIDNSAKTQGLPAVAADTTGWMVVWQSWPADSHFPTLHARRVNYDGTLGTTDLEFGDTSGIGSYPRIAYNATEDRFGVIYATSNHNRATARRAYVNILTTTPSVYSLGTDFIGGESQAPHHYNITADPSAGWIIICSGKAGQPLNTKPGQAAVTIDANGDFAAGNYMNGSENVTSQWVAPGDPAGWEYFVDSEGGSFTKIPYGFNDLTMDATYAIAAWEKWDIPSKLSLRANHASIAAGRLNGYDLVEAIGGTDIVVGGSGVSYQKPALAGDGAGNVLITYTKYTDGSMEIGSKLLTGVGTAIPTGVSEVILRSDSTNGSRRSYSDVAYGDDEGGADANNPLYFVVWTEGWWGTL